MKFANDIGTGISVVVNLVANGMLVLSSIQPAEQKKATLENGPYIKDGKPNGRPGPSGKNKLAFEEAVYKKSLDVNGVPRDANTREQLDWKPGEPRTGKVDFGHVRGSGYKKIFERYKNQEITLEQLKEFQSNPDNFQLENPSSNRSQKYD